MADVKAKRTLTKQVEESAVANKCLICGGEAKGKRGLCNAHYLQFYRRMMELPRKERAAFEEEQIREGRVLASGQLRQLKKPNPFVREAS